MRELSLHVLDILQNSLEAGATRVELSLDEDMVHDLFSITIRDNGRGMDETQIVRATDPFFTTRTTRHVGLGLPLLAAAAEHCDGGLQIKSKPGEGTTVEAVFRHSHIDRAPLGNIQGSLLAFIMSDNAAQACDLSFRHRVNEREFAFDTADIRRELEGVPFSHPMVRNWLREFVSEGEKDVYEAAP